MDDTNTDSGAKESTYGLGSIEYEPRTGRYRLRHRSLNESKWFDTREDAEAVRHAIGLADNIDRGITVRQWLVLWLAEHDFGKAIPATVRALITCDPQGEITRGPEFIDWPLTTLSSGDGATWAVKLDSLPATQIKRRKGVSTTITLDHAIGRAYAKSALSAMRCALEAAKNRKPQLITVNPFADVKLPSPKSKNGKRRTKKVKRNANKLEFLPQHDCMAVFFCKACQAANPELERLEVLVKCEHMPFFYRVAHSVSIMQALRAGEIASQRWERIYWVDSGNWTGHSWVIETSWQDDSTKSGQDRIQALIPMSAQLLHRWWQFKGCPKTGLVFCTADAAPKRALGELAKFVARYPKHTNAALVGEAQRQGVSLTLRRCETLRSEARKRAERKRSAAEQMFAQGYDFGWADTRETQGGDEVFVRPGWCTKLGLSVRTRFHDYRDTSAAHLLSGTWGVTWSMQMVSEHLGHSDIKVTQDRYAHVTVEAKTEAAARVDPSLLSAPGRRVGPSEIARKLPEPDPDATSTNSNDSSGSGKGTRTPDQSVNSSSGKQGDQQFSSKFGQSSGNVAPPSAALVSTAKELLAAVAEGRSLRAGALQLAGAILDAAEVPEGPVSPYSTRPLRLVKAES